MYKFKIKQRVILKANPKEGWTEECGVIVEVESRGNMYIVKIDQQYFLDDEDDGIREIEGRFMTPEV